MFIRFDQNIFEAKNVFLVDSRVSYVVGRQRKERKS